mmetsp:Transcript_27931/g.50468  ORF Transcript_27931/g.50468 Transcript_27931/m.50468 type:complete len:83 (+) Transcript_27931:86-334(+)
MSINIMMYLKMPGMDTYAAQMDAASPMSKDELDAAVEAYMMQNASVFFTSADVTPEDADTADHIGGENLKAGETYNMFVEAH